MTLAEIIGVSGAGVVAVIFGLIKVSPIQISIWHWIARKLGKMFNGEVFDKVSDLETSFSSHLDEHKQKDAETNRQRILRFADEMYDNKYHSKESFEDILDIIQEYDKYCTDHPEFKNKRTETASKIIAEKYEECLKEHKF